MYIDLNNGICVGGVIYNNEFIICFYLDIYIMKFDIIDVILNIGIIWRESVYENDIDFVYKGLEMVYDFVFLFSRGDRVDVFNYYIYIMDYIFFDDDFYIMGFNIWFIGDSYIWVLGVKFVVI